MQLPLPYCKHGTTNRRSGVTAWVSVASRRPKPMSTMPVARSSHRCTVDRCSQPTPWAIIQARVASQAPVSAMNHSPKARENIVGEAPAGMKPGRNEMKKTPIFGLQLEYQGWPCSGTEALGITGTVRGHAASARVSRRLGRADTRCLAYRRGRPGRPGQPGRTRPWSAPSGTRHSRGRWPP